jgi:hypothetical protein
MFKETKKVFKETGVKMTKIKFDFFVWLDEIKHTIELQHETNEFNRGAKQGKLFLIDLIKRKLREKK